EPEAHSVKSGTPTMGGLMIFLTVGLMTVPFNLLGKLSILLPLGTIVSCGLLGGIDDLMNIVGGSRTGMQARFKFVWLLIIAIIAAVVLHFYLQSQRVFIPFVGSFPIGLWYLPVAVIAIMGTAHAVNLTDGLDTLAGSNAAVAFAAYAIIA